MPPVVMTRRQALLDANYQHAVFSPVKRKRTLKREKEQKESRNKEQNKNRVATPEPSPLEAHFGAPHLAGVKKFQDTLDTTCTRLLGLADTMTVFTDNKEIVEKVHDEIDAFIGQARLLVASKLKKQFGKMLSDAVDPAYAPPTSLEDLTGFWEMVQIQIGKADESYEALEKLRKNNWVEEVVVPVKKAAPLKNKVAKTTRPVMSAKAAEAAKARADKMKEFKAQMLAKKAQSGKENEAAAV